MSNGRRPSSLALRVALLLVAYRLILFAAWVAQGMAPPQYADLLWGSVASIALLVLSRAVLAREQRSPRMVGLAPDVWTIARLLGGAAIGLSVYGATIAVISPTLVPIQFSLPNWPSATMGAVTLAS